MEIILFAPGLPPGIRLSFCWRQFTYALMSLWIALFGKKYYFWDYYICRLNVRISQLVWVFLQQSDFRAAFCFNQEQEIFLYQLSSPIRLKWLTIGILLESQRPPRQRLAVHLILLKEWQSAAARSEPRGASRRLPGTLRGPEKDLENTLKRAYGGIWEGPKRLGVRNQSAWGENSSFGLSVSLSCDENAAWRWSHLG